jgi:[ribosomal protein S18]-alanine N-acetyltransferase
MTDVEIIAGDARDIASIMPVMSAAFDPCYGEAWTASQCLSVLSLPDSHLHLARQGPQMVGFALTRGVLDEEELLLIAVRPELSRKGIATAILEAVIALAQKKGRARLFIEVRQNNSAIDFYRHAGFAAVGTRPAYYSGPNGNRFDATTMQLNI